MSAPTRPAASPAQVRPQGGRRWTELALILLACAISAAGHALVDLNFQQNLTGSFLWFGALLTVAFVTAHLAVRQLAPHADPVLLPAVALLCALSLVMIRRIDLAARAQLEAQGIPVTNNGNADDQLMWFGVGLVLMVATLFVVRDHRMLQRYTYLAGAVGLFIMVIPMLLPPSMSEVNGARIWIRLPGFSIQPAEFSKILLAIFFAGYLALKRGVLTEGVKRVAGLPVPQLRGVSVLIAAWIIGLLILVFENDLGTAMLFFGLVLVMFYAATRQASWLFLGLGAFVGAMWAGYFLFSHVATRIDIWLDPYQDPQGAAYQLLQGMYGFAAGGLFGTGLGLGNPQLVPFARTDFITSALGEEIGLYGLTALLLMYVVITQRAISTALRLPDTFGRLLAVGLGFIICLQVFVIVGGVTKLLPLTGLTTPFLSYGGSSTMTNFILIALLLRMSDDARRPRTQGAAPEFLDPDEFLTPGRSSALGGPR